MSEVAAMFSITRFLSERRAERERRRICERLDATLKPNPHVWARRLAHLPPERRERSLRNRDALR